MEPTTQKEKNSTQLFSVPNPANKTPRSKFNYLFKILGFLMVVLVILTGAYYFISKQKPRTADGYAQIWRLVDEKISKSAPVKIYIPKGFTADQVKSGASFDPKIDGSWVTRETGVFNFAGLAFGADARSAAAPDYVEFKPASSLVINHYYALKVDLGAGKNLAADFAAVDDPAIEAIFPESLAEAPENSKITIIFSRPMVPLTTLEALDTSSIDVAITPKTEGHFKWISTNTLQFISKVRLQRSSNYTVKVGDLVSLDGLKVAGKTASFKTRSLRYDSNAQPDKLIYNQPLRVYFNQPVDLQKTVALMKVVDTSTQKEIPIVVQYSSSSGQDQQSVAGPGSFSRFMTNAFGSLRQGLVSVFGIPVLQKTTPDNTDANESVLEVYAKNDKFGRSKMWDTQTSYELTIAKAYPKEGDISIGDQQQFDATTTGIVGAWGAASDRTSYANLDMFDPQGKLTVSFYETINIGASRITSDAAIKNIAYGKKCSDDNLSILDFNCVKVDDPKTLEIAFDQNLPAARQFTVSLDRVVNDKNQVINGEKVTQLVKVYAPLQLRVASVALDSAELCSNNPLQAPDQKDLKNGLKADKDYEIFSWGSSWQVSDKNQWRSSPCAAGEFDTRIGAGFMPQTAYQITANASDVFGQAGSADYNTTTGAMDKKYVDIYSLQGNYNVATPAKRKLTFSTKNITYADIEVCKLSAIDLYSEYRAAGDHYPLPANCLQIARKRVDLPQRYWIDNYFTLDIGEMFNDPIGNYVITVGNPDYVDYQGKPEHQVNFLTVTNLAAAQKTIDPQQNFDYQYNEDQTALSDSQLDALQNLYWVTDIASLSGVKGATVTIYDNTGRVVDSGQTNDQGLAFFRPRAGIEAAVIQSGEDSTVIGNNESNLNWAQPAANIKKGYIYTDKPIYRPGDTVNIKGILRLGYDGNYQAWPLAQVDLEGTDAANDNFWQKSETLDNYGTFGDSITLAAKSPLGSYRICVKGTYQCGSFDVQEYAPASFVVTAKSQKDEYISKDTAKIDISANYYFGVPVANATVEYTLSAQNYYFDKLPDGYYNSGFYGDCPTDYCYGDQFISRGTATLDDKGQATISQSLDLQKLFPDANNGQYRNSRILVLDATVKNSLGQTISAQSSFIVHAGEFYLGAQADPSFGQTGQNINVGVKSVDVSGQPKDAGSVTAQAYLTDWIYAKRLDASGGFSYDWTQKRDLVKTFNLSRNDLGSYSAALHLDKSGEYEIDVASTDSKGNPVMSRVNVYVTGAGFASVRPYNDTTLTLTAAKKDLKAGDKGEFVIESPYQHAKALVALERGKLFSYQIIDVNGNLVNYQFDVKDDYAPNIFASVLLQSADPEVKFGSIEYTVDAASHKVNIAVTAGKKTYQPGDNAILSFATTNSNNKPVAAQMSVAVVDLSVLALKGNPKKDPLVFFYDGLPLTVKTASTIDNILKEVQPGSATKGGSGGGGGETKVRGDFKETAFWQGVLTTGSDGKASVTFKLPDNLTTWQAESVGITQDSKVGVGYAQFQTQKDLMVVAQKPRFVIPGDTLSLAAQAFNQTGKDQDVTVSFSSDTLRFLDKNTAKKISIKAGRNATVYAPVLAPLNMTLGVHSFTVKAQGSGVGDAVAQTIPIKPNLTYEVTATANYTTADKTSETVLIPDNVELNMGQLTINSSATLAVYLSNSLQYLVGYPYGCTEQVSSQLKSLAVVKSGLNIPNLADKFNLKITDENGNKTTLDHLIAAGLAKLYANQDSGGCFGMWNSQNPNYYMTLSAVDAFNSLKASGVAVDDSAYSQATKCLYKEFTDTTSQYNVGPAGIIEGAAVLLGSSAFKDNQAVIHDAVLSIASSVTATDDKLSNKTLARLALIINNNGFDPAAVKRVNSLLDNRIEIDSRGAFLQRNDTNASWNYFETTIGDTAIYLRSLAAGKRETSFNDKVVRWLLNSRDKDGAWGSTQDTLNVVQAFVDFLKWKNETNASFNLAINLNGKNISSHDFNSKTILDQAISNVPIKDLNIGFSSVDFVKAQKDPLAQNNLYYDMGLKYYINGTVGPRDEGFGVNRSFYALSDTNNANPLASANVGDVIREHIEVTAGQDRRFVSVEDFIPAGFEIVNTDLATEQQSLRFTELGVANPLLQPDYTQMFDDRALLYKESLPQGVYQYDYYVRALVKGKYFQPPTVASEIYNPENFGRTASNYFEIK